MKLPLAVIIVGWSWSVQPLVIMAQMSKQAIDDYVVGREVGKCLVAKCQVLRGHLTTESPKSGQLVTVEVDEGLFGPTVASGTVQVPYSTVLLPKALSESPGWAWRNVDLATNAPLTFVLALEQIGAAKPGAPVLVTSDEREATIIRSLTELARQLESSPSLASSVISTLSDPAVAAFLIVFTNHLALKDPEAASSLFQNMIGNPRMPAETWSQIADSMLLEYFRLSENGKGSVVRRFTELAQRPDPQSALLGFKGLMKLAGSHDEVPALIPAGALKGLAKAYNALVKRGNLRRDPSFEAELGIKDK